MRGPIEQLFALRLLRRSGSSADAARPCPRGPTAAFSLKRASHAAAELDSFGRLGTLPFDVSNDYRTLGRSVSALVC